MIIYTQSPSLLTAIASLQMQVAAYLMKPVEMSLLIDQVKTSIASCHDIIRNVTSWEDIHSCQDEIDQTKRLTKAIEETINMLQSTRGSFKSKKLAALRRKLERLLASENPE